MGDRDGWAALERVYRERGLVLAIGAGVSLGSGVPMWADLLARIADKLPRDQAFATKGRRLLQDLRTQGFSLAAIASILRARCESDAQFANLVRDVLYRDFPPYKDLRANQPEGYSSIKRACRTNSTLRSVAALCAVPVKRTEGLVSYRRNPLVHGVVSFNVDTLLRVYVEARYGRRPDGHVLVRSVERASQSSDASKISIYYMHGCLRFDVHANDPEKESDKLVFTEQQYFDFFNDPTGHFNYTFLYLLREHPCLFIGLSMQDDNIRRLLHYSRSERVGAYMDERRTTRSLGGAMLSSDAVAVRAAQSKAEAKSNRHFAVLKRCAQSHLNDLTERSLSRLGTTVLWVDEHRDIRRRLRRVYEGAGAKSRPDWALVY